MRGLKMGTQAYSFISIFDYANIQKDEIIKLKKIIIPMIQRDYAQGRTSPEIARIRNRFLQALKNAITGAPITLDFIYGDIDGNGIMTPLDGQQRLTTLFLLHWYAAKKENIAVEKYSFLKMFSYETRYSARDFCTLLVDFNITILEGESIADKIKNEYWFPLSWTKDPTISSMLVVLDAIHEQFFTIENLWDELESGKISFYFLPIKDMGLTDELYIKMNSRGKPLTQFEHFKADFERFLTKIDPKIAARISSKIDKEWTSLLWNYRGDDNIIDDEFLRYFRFICDVISYKNDESSQRESNDEFDLLSKYFDHFSGGSSAIPIKNVELLESYFDCWINIKEGNVDNFFEKFNHDNIFQDALENYADISGNKQTKFSLSKKIILYATVIFLLNRDSITDEQYKRRLRIIKNLISNSQDEISESENRDGGNRMPRIFKQVDSIILNGTIDDTLPHNFNTHQLIEEKEKITWCVNNPLRMQELFSLEDHELLYGQIAIVGLENIDLCERFQSLFKCSLDKVNCALLVLGDYSQTNSWRRQLGSSRDESWKNLFHKSNNGNFDKTKEILIKLLLTSVEFNDVFLSKISDDFLQKCETNNEYPWEYYFIKYPYFRSDRYGKYYWATFEEKKYELVFMYTPTKLSDNAYQPFLKGIDGLRLNRDNCGRSLVYNDKFVVTCENDRFMIKSTEKEEVLAEIIISQNEDNIDTEDRILKGRNLVPQEIQRLKDEEQKILNLMESMF